MGISISHGWGARLIVLALAVIAGLSSVRAKAESFEQALKEKGGIVLMRHALAPGTGDPANFLLENCATQRNLNDEGRAQAQAIGELLRGMGVEEARVYSSQWCRCLETAELLDLGKVQPQPLINSFFQDASVAPERTEQLKAWLTEQSVSEPIVLVTHQVNITRLTGVYPASGEMTLIRMEAGEPVVIAREKTR